ncbi:S-layer homology domain-containing protein [Bacillus piscicola]|uniref:S-layer homology domain-containing protein n=1 Tax=Bacillus piscicola TaxID=1632684 RepID=UPI001F096336|nr:S-layer homology domain-containing protein [Bacillus piscicola]
MKRGKTKTWLLAGALAWSSLAIVQPVSAASSFTDVPEDYWAYEEMDEMVSEGIVSGYPDGTFRPQQPVTRAQSAVILGRALDVDTVKRAEPVFSDVTPTTSGAGYIAALVEEGIFKEGDTFRPGESLTRAQMAKILVEAFGLEGKGDKVFSDVTYTYWAYDYVSTLVANEITTGTTPYTFSPSDPVTRVQLAVFVERALAHSKKAEENVPEGESDHAGETTAPTPDDPPAPEQDEKEDKDEKRSQGIESLADLRRTYSGEMTAEEKEVLRLVNEIRKEHGLAAVKANPDAVRLARFKSEDMRDLQYFDHISPVYGMDMGLDEKLGLPIVINGSNIAAAAPTPELVVDAWMRSPGHRDNILANYVSMGVGEAEGGIYLRYWTQIFVYEELKQ